MDTYGFIKIDDSVNTPEPTCSTYRLVDELSVIDVSAVTMLVKFPPVICTVIIVLSPPVI